jgi:arabinose-5-phosphate isomerase
MHAADAVHGDLGTIQKEDIIICISKSGNTPEIKVLAPMLKESGNKLIAMTGDTSSFLALSADHVLNTYVEKEACPHNLAPTSSTTAQLAMGDALAVCLLEARGFSSNDFAKFHPGGALGKRLYLKAGDLCIENERPQVAPFDGIAKVIHEISSKRLGATAVIENGKIAGIITDGDLRRMIEKKADFSSVDAASIMNRNPKTIEKTNLAAEALEIMKSNNIGQLIVTEEGAYAGFIHIQDLLRQGIL